MKRLLISALAAASLAAVVTPALAQPYGGASYGRYENGDGYGNINARQAELARRIDDGARRGDLTRSEASSLRHELRSLEWLEQRYRNSGYNGRSGLSPSERADLDRRLDILAQKVERDRHDYDRRGRGWDNRSR